MKEITKDTPGLTITLDCEPEEVPIKGNASAIDEETDAATYKWIESELADGNQWAWCQVAVTVAYKDIIKSTQYLGCCSYENEAAFRAPGGYFDDLVREGIADLNAKRKVLLTDLGRAGR